MGYALAWDVNFHPEFDTEYDTLDKDVRLGLLSHIQKIRQSGHQLSRPHVDTLNGSKHANMKELRFKAAGGVWRFAFAFDPTRQAVVLCGGDKSDMKSNRFYNKLLKTADARFDSHLKNIQRNQPTHVISAAQKKT